MQGRRHGLKGAQDALDSRYAKLSNKQKKEHARFEQFIDRARGQGLNIESWDRRARKKQRSQPAASSRDSPPGVAEEDEIDYCDAADAADFGTAVAGFDFAADLSISVGDNNLFDDCIRIVHSHSDGQGVIVSVPWQWKKQYHKTFVNFALIGLRWVHLRCPPQLDSEDQAAEAAKPLLVTWCKDCPCGDQRRKESWENVCTLFEGCKEAAATMFEGVAEPCPCTKAVLRCVYGIVATTNVAQLEACTVVSAVKCGLMRYICVTSMHRLDVHSF